MDNTTIIIGGGPAGLALSYHLSRLNIAHRILEAGQIGESWRRRRWDSLHLVAPNWHLQLPGMPYDGADPGGFLQRDQVVGYIERYARLISAPVECNTHVTGVAPHSVAPTLQVATTAGSFVADQVVVATGAYATPSIPACAAALPAQVAQIHAMHYRNAEHVPPGAVLVVGSGESGCQIAEELRHAGRDVWLAVGRCGWLPRRYRDRDCIAWITDMGGFEQTVDELPGGDRRFAPPGPQLTGKNGGHDLNLHTLAASGVRLVGRLAGATSRELRFAPDAATRTAEADQAASDFCQAVDDYIQRYTIDAPAETLPKYRQAYAAVEQPVTTIDIAQAELTSVVWATGYRPSFDWIDLPVVDQQGYPIHVRGVTTHPGLFFVGLEWQYKAKSHIFQGIGEDAAYIAQAVAARAKA